MIRDRFRLHCGNQLLERGSRHEDRFDAIRRCLSCSRSRVKTSLGKHSRIGSGNHSSSVHRRDDRTQVRLIRAIWEEEMRGMNQKATLPDRPALADLQQIDAVCDRFEKAWRPGQRPDIAEFLVAGAGPCAGALVSRSLEPRPGILPAAWRAAGCAGRTATAFLNSRKSWRRLSSLISSNSTVDRARSSATGTLTRQPSTRAHSQQHDGESSSGFS